MKKIKKQRDAVHGGKPMRNLLTVNNCYPKKKTYQKFLREKKKMD